MNSRFWQTTLPVVIAVIALVVSVGTLFGVVNAPQLQGVTNFDTLAARNAVVSVPTSQATATPGVLINNPGVNVPFEIKVAGTTVAKIDRTGAQTMNGIQTLPNDLVISSDETGGVNGRRNEIVGRYKATGVVLGTMTNGAAAGKTVALMDDTPAGEWTASDADVTCGNDAAYERVGTNALAMAFLAAADAGDGCHDGVTYDFTDDESIGLWVYSTKALEAGDLRLANTDDGGVISYTLPALAVNTYTWVELNIGATANGSKDVITDLELEIVTAGLDSLPVTVYVDGAYKWDATEEEALSQNIVQDGVLATFAVATAAGGANTPLALVEDTDFFVHYETGNDFLVTITDQSANSGFALVAVQ